MLINSINNMRPLIPVILIAICVGAYYMYLGPTFSEIQDITSKKSEYTVALEKIQALSEKRDQMRAAYDAVPQPSMDRLQKIIPETFSSVAIANDINTVAGHSGFIIQAFKVSEPQVDTRERVIGQTAGSTYKTHLVSFKVKGQYAQFIRFLRELETNAFLADVQTISAVPDPTSKDGGDMYEYSISFASYSLR